MPDKRKRRIAVVDDERDFLTLVEGWLKPQYDVWSFADAAAASEQIGDLDPDLVILDVRMPSGSGFDVCRWLRSAPEYADMPIVFLTGSTSQADFKRHVSAGGSAYLTKPIERGALLSAVEKMLAAPAAQPSRRAAKKISP